MDLASLGEFGAIALFRELLGPPSPGVDIAIGDDAAVWRPTPGHAAIQTTDLLVEDVHFSLRWCTWEEVGWKAMAVNVSDVAAMGGRPRAAFVSAGLKPGMARDDAVALFRGLAACARAYGLDVLGGDTVASPAATVLNVALHGETLDATSAVLRRDAARPGDAIAVTGALGASAAYLAVQTAPTGQRSGLAADHGNLRAAHCHPEPRVELGQRLLRAGVRCAMDVSDGLLADLAKVCAASGAGARIDAERVPVGDAVRRLLPERALELALTGGEDYELLVCGSEEVLQQLGLTIIGAIVAGDGVQAVDQDGRELRFQTAGYDAFGGGAGG